MITTSQLIQTSTSYFFPVLVLLILWYGIASAFRSFFELGFRFFRSRGAVKALRKRKEKLWLPEEKHKKEKQEKKKDPEKTKEMIVLQAEASKVDHSSGQPQEYIRLRSDIAELENEIQYLNTHISVLQEESIENRFLGLRSDKLRLLWLFTEGALFTVLVIASLYFLTGTPIHKKIPLHLWWIHGIGAAFFLCIISEYRRILILLPLTVMAFLSFEVFSFITNFEQTLKATSILATVKVVNIHSPKQPKDTTQPRVKPKATIQIRYPNGRQKTFVIDARRKLYVEGRFFRISTEVLLFGGKNIASIDRIFSDVLASESSILLVDEGAIPPQYQLKQADFNVPHFLPRQKMFYWLWKQFFQLKEKQSSSPHKYIKMVPLASVACTPLLAGKEFEIRLRHVGGLECYTVNDKKTSLPDPATKSLAPANKSGKTG